MNLLKKLFRKSILKEGASDSNKGIDTESKPNYENEINFEELIRKTKISEKGEDVLKIWNIMLNLKEWHFITIYNSDLEKIKPFVGVLDNQPWIFIFSNTEKALEFTKSDNRFLSENGESQIITKSVENSLKMISDLEQNGVFGLRVNENDSETNANFNIPISVLNQIIRIVNKRE